MDWQEITAQKFDVVIIGAGINGAGIALDAAQRGLHVLIVDKSDFGSGTTSASTRLIHGGLRYLEYLEFSLVRESLREREILLDIAGNAVQPIPLVLPIYKHSRRGKFLIRSGMILYDLLSLNKSLPNHRMLSRQELLQMEPALKKDGLYGGALYYDSQVEFPERLCWSIIRKARKFGATAINYCEAVALDQARSSQNVLLQDARTGKQYTVAARIIVNATGPWVDQVRSLRDPRSENIMGGTKGSHIVVRKKPGGPKHAVYVEAQQDGRPFFILPWLNHYLIGTTDLKYEGNLDDVVISEDEVEYLLSETNCILENHGFSTDDILYAYSGVRPLPAVSNAQTAAITRRHHIKSENNRHENAYFDIVGGKLTTYRSLAEQAVDKIMHLLGDKNTGVRSRTDEVGLLNNGSSNGKFNLQQNGIDKSTWDYLQCFYGDAAQAVAAMLAMQPALNRTISPHRPDIWAQVIHAVQAEDALCLEDIFLRRTSAGWGEDMGLESCELAAKMIGPLLGWDVHKQEEEARKYKEKILHKHIPEFLPAGKKWRQKYSHAD